MALSTGLVRLGGISGLLYVLLLIPSFILGRPDAVEEPISTQGVIEYYTARHEAFLLGNRVIVHFAVFFFFGSSAYSAACCGARKGRDPGWRSWR
jgi:hypothetical protein